MPYPEQLQTAPEAPASTSDRELCPLSFAQERLWFLDQLQPGSAAYNVPQAWRLKGDLDKGAFTKAVNTVVRRHESLRTTFSRIEGKPVEIISRYKPFDIEVVRIGADSESDEAEAIRRTLQAAALKPFHLQQGPLYRVQLFQLSPQDHIALLVVHHIVADAWSFEILRREVTAVYEAAISGKETSLPELPIQYLDYAHWQRERITGTLLAEQVDFWKSYLAGELPRLELPGQQHHPSNSDHCLSTPFVLDRDITERLRRIAQDEGATLFTVLFAAFNVLLHRVTGQRDFILGTPISCRDEAETENLIGLLVNTIPLRTEIKSNSTFRDLIGDVRASIFQAFAHHETPADEILKAVNVPRDGQDPLFNAVMALHGGFASGWSLGNVAAEMVDVEVPVAKFDFAFLLEETGCGIKGRLEHKTDLFDDAFMRRLLQQFHLLLDGIARNPARLIGQYPILSETERRLVTAEWNQTASDHERDSCIHQLFEAQARQTSDSIAIEAGSTQLTYRELNCRADQLAQRLRKSGVQPNSLVGLATERSANLIIGMLAVLKAGAAYVPLDRNYPRERLQWMIAETKLSVIVSEGAFDSLLQSGDAVSAVKLIQIDAESSAETNTLPAVTEVSPLSPAYVMFTSGSTGSPKGVEVPHRAVIRLVRGNDYASFSTDETFLQLAPASFDASTFEIWGALLNGAKLVLFPPHSPTLEELGRFIAEKKITTLWLTAGLFHQMVDQQIEALKPLRQLLAGGDVLSVSHVLKVLRELPKCRLINGYGPTENTTFTCCWTVPSDWPGNRSVPIGRPIRNTRVYVMDELFEPVPIGVPGELFVGGDGLANGYLNQPELTREKFVVVSTPQAPQGETLYRTGDRVRWLDDGTLEFLGRNDRQLKIRGFRIEPAEVETALLRHPSVRQAVAIGHRNAAGEPELVAYVKLHDRAVLDDAALRTFLAESLPPHTIPSRFIPIEAIPLTPNGKIDTRALPSPDSDLPKGESVAPRDETEQRLHLIWQEVLGRNSFGVEDNFFLLGGHSLLVIRMISRIARSFSVELPVRAVFESPTVAGLALKLKELAPARPCQESITPRITPRLRAQQLLTRINELTDAEVESLLTRQK